jgi:hypothetical protein
MSRTTGLRLGTRRFEIVALEGSAKKPKLRGLAAGMSADAASGLEGQKSALAELIKGQRKALEAEEIQLSIDGGLGIYRHLSLPFAEREKIEEVIRFEVESKIPQADIDNLVVDFFITEATPVESHLLVTAVPAPALQERIELAAGVGLEPVEAELETASLFHAAEFIGALTAGAAQLLVHLGERTTSIVVASDGRLRSMRALHLAIEAEGGEPAAEGEPAPAASAPLDAAQLLPRLHKEFLRTLTSADSGVPFDRIWVCGLVPPGLVGSRIGEVEVALLDPLASIGKEDLPAEERARYAIAFGAAWGRMGSGQLRPHLRRDALAYAGTFERLELPLGVLGLLLLTLLFSRYIIVRKQVEPRQQDVALWMDCVRNYTVGKPEEGAPGFLTDPPKQLVTILKDILAGKNADQTTPLDQFDSIKRFLDGEIRRYKTMLGTGDSSTQPQSALTATNLVFDVINGLGEERIGRIAVRKLDAKWVRAAGGDRDPEHIAVRLDLSFFADDDVKSTQHFNNLMEALDGQEWCLGTGRQALEPFNGENRGSAVNGVEVKVDVSKSPALRSEQAAAEGAQSPARG